MQRWGGFACRQVRGKVAAALGRPPALPLAVAFQLPRVAVRVGGATLSASGLLTGDFALAPALVLGATLRRPPQWHRLLTSAFLHGSAVHLFYNLRHLLRAAWEVERLAGPATAAATYAIAAVAASAAHLAVSVAVVTPLTSVAMR